MRGSYCLVFALGGCAQLAGIDKTNGDNRDVTLTFDRLSVGATVTSAPLVLDTLTANYLVPDADDATVLDLEVADPEDGGTWQAHIQEGTPPVLFTLPDMTQNLWSLPARDMRGELVALEHANAMPAPAGATISVTSALDTPATATESFELLDVGTWARQAITATAATTALDFTGPYSAAVNLAAPLQLAAITPDDVLLVMRYEAGVMTGLGEMVPAGTQAAATTIAPAVVAVAADQSFAMPIDPTGFGDRFVGQKPLATSALSMSYAINAAPGFAHGVTAGPTLSSGAIPATTTSLAGTYPNPFAASHMWPSALTFVATKSRTYAPPSGETIALSTSLSETLTPDGATPIMLSAPLPAVITLGITPLVGDGTSVLVDLSKPVPVSFTTDGLAATLYRLDLYELTPSGTTFDVTHVMSLAGDQPSWMIPPGSPLLPAHTYVFIASTIGGGGLDPTTGDLTTLAPPFASGSHAGGVFTVTL